MKIPTLEAIENCLPQTQCGLCGYSGCKPYAIALRQNQASIGLCPPGGVRTLYAIAKLFEKDPSPYLDEVKQKSIPNRLAKIQEKACIGCTKCIHACPVDAILGSRKKMHTVITNECTGCAKCLPVCPVDCIILHSIPEYTTEQALEKAYLARKRFHTKEQRLKQQATVMQSLIMKKEKTIQEKQQYIQAALARVRNKKRNLPIY